MRRADLRGVPSYHTHTQALEKLLNETAQEPGCTVCYTDAAVKAELEAARATLGAERVAAYDKLPVCYTLLADRMLEELPRSADGTMIVAHPKLADQPLKQVCRGFPPSPTFP